MMRVLVIVLRIRLLLMLCGRSQTPLARDEFSELNTAYGTMPSSWQCYLAEG